MELLHAQLCEPVLHPSVQLQDLGVIIYYHNPYCLYARKYFAGSDNSGAYRPQTALNAAVSKSKRELPD